MNCLLLDTLNRENVSNIPVWLMRQAGRYLPEYRKLKEVHGFLGLCQNPELATEITLQPLRRFGMDAAILFADIMLPAECLKFKFEFSPGPTVENPISSAKQISDIPSTPDLTSVSYVFEALSRIKESLQSFSDQRGRKALLGFAATPWTLACYLIDQSPYKHFSGTSIFAAKHPEDFNLLMEKITNLTIEYCKAQIEAGADAIQLFDSWGGILGFEDYKQITFNHNARLVKELKNYAPVIFYSNGSSHLVDILLRLDANALSLDWRTPLDSIESNSNLVIQGNLDPASLFCGEEVLNGKIDLMLNSAPHGRYIANLGHGVLQHTPVQSVELFVDKIKAINL